MQWNHVGLNIGHREEIENFYREILGFKLLRTFPITGELSRQIFQIAEGTQATLMNRGDVTVELFLCTENRLGGYAHLCIDVENREEIVRKCLLKGYPVFRKKRDKGDLIFIRDLSGNIFELKEKN